MQNLAFRLKSSNVQFPQFPCPSAASTSYGWAAELLVKSSGTTTPTLVNVWILRLFVTMPALDRPAQVAVRPQR